MPIQILPEDVTSAIAAGEVVERPASVVKELLENAIDAGARYIEIVVERGGSALVEVSDDGYGIPAEEVPLAIARFATSKLSTREDLFAIRTLGFRGEALSSIGAVSRMELQSKFTTEETGTILKVEGGQVNDPQSMGLPQGTVIRVRDLFFNVPARRKFLKSETTERRRISALVTRYAMAYPQIRIRLTQEGRTSFQTSGSGDLREVLAEVFGVETARQMIALPEGLKAPIRVHGFVSPSTIHRGNRRQLIFFVNGRWVQDASLSASVLQAYHTLLMVGRYPVVVLMIEMPPEEVDVNVHPTKAEVRFRNQQLVFSVLQRIVRTTLLGQAPPPSFRTGTGWGSDEWKTQSRVINQDWRLAQTPSETMSPDPSWKLQPALTGGAIPLLRIVGQVGGAYLVAEGPDGLYLIDQHAAHERVLFETLMNEHGEGVVASQTLLEPLTLEFSPEQASLLEEQLGVLVQLGFQVEPFGHNVFRLRGLPALFVSQEPEQVLRAVVEDFEEDETPMAAENEARLAARVCKRASIKAGQVLSLAEQKKLLRDLEACQSPRTCPHGRPTMIHLPVEVLEKQFGR